MRVSVRVRHTDDAACPLCWEKLKGAHAYLRSWFYEKKRKYPNLHVSWAWRGKEDQERMFREGASRAHFGQSAHNAVDAEGKPCARALDLFQIDEDGVARFSRQFMKKLWDECKGEPLRWGGNFKSIGDECHFEYSLHS